MARRIDENSPLWIPTKTAGLYQSRESLRYYSRLLVDGRYPYVSLKTKIYSEAAALHAERMVQLQRDNRAGRPDGRPVETDISLTTMGGLAKLVEAQLKNTNQDQASKSNYVTQIAAARRNWPGANFETFPVGKITFDLLLQLKSNLQTAEWSGPAGFDHKARRKGKGYSNRYVNQVLARVKNILDLGRHHGQLDHDPFLSPNGIGGSIWLPLPNGKKDLPSLDQMKAVFREMAGVPPERMGGSGDNEPNYLRFREERAKDGAELAEFLAYSGCRISEATGSAKKDGSIKTPGAIFEDFNPNSPDGPTFRIRGSKGRESDRVIDAIPDLVQLVERMRQRRLADGDPVTGPMFRVKTCRYGLKIACERVGCMRLGHHTLRHYFATFTLGSGVPVTIVAEWLGHRDKGATLLRTYAHVIRAHSAHYAKRINFSQQNTPPAIVASPAPS